MKVNPSEKCLQVSKAPWDWKRSNILTNLPAIDPSPEVDPAPKDPHDTTSALLTLVSTNAGASLTGMEVLTTNEKESLLTTSQTFEDGIHWLELTHFCDFKGVRLGVVAEKEDPAESIKSNISIDQQKSAIICLNVHKGLL